jgi:hypothetical protein
MLLVGPHHAAEGGTMARKKTGVRMSHLRRFDEDAVRNELIRRELFPATSALMGLTVPQAVTVADLEAELAAMSRDDGRRDWFEWELALAREHYRLNPIVPFVRYVFRDKKAS